MISFPSLERAVKIRFSLDDLLIRAQRLEVLQQQASSPEEKRNWTHDLRRVRRELRQLEPARHCASLRPAPKRQARRAGCRRSPRLPHRGHGGTPPPSEPGGSDGDGGDGDPNYSRAISISREVRS
jgi:hypothetical protein